MNGILIKSKRLNCLWSFLLTNTIIRLQVLESMSHVKLLLKLLILVDDTNKFDYIVKLLFLNHKVYF